MPLAFFALGLGIVAGTAALLSWPRGVALIAQHARICVLAGWSLCATGALVSLGGPVFLIFEFSTVNDAVTNACIYAGLAAILVGFMIAQLPGMGRRLRQSRVDAAKLASAGVERRDFNGPQEAFEAFLSVGRGWPAFLQIVAPWVLFSCASLYWLLPAGEHLDHDAGKAQWFLLGLLGVMILLGVSIPTTAAAWCQWILRGERPPHFLALPNRRAWSIGWRLWVFAGVMGAADGWASNQMIALAPGLGFHDGAFAGSVAGVVIDILALMVASSLALRLPALVVGDLDFSPTVARIEGRRMWPGLPFGLVLSLAPYLIAGWIVNVALEWFGNPTVGSAHFHVTPLSIIQLAAGLIFYFAAIASAATFLSRSYLAAKARISATDR
jgi:hypothetical protein